MSDMPPIRIYAASRASLPERPALWRSLRAEGAAIISSWIDEDAPGATEDFGELWSRIEGEIMSSDRFVLYVEAGDLPLKGALVEVGMALAMKKPVIIVVKGLSLNPGDLKPLGSWAKHPSVTLIDDIRSAVGLTRDTDAE